MKNKYVVTANRWWLAVVWVMSVALPTQAQTSRPPFIEWQRVVEPNRGVVDSPPRVVKADNGGFAVVAGAELIRLSASGDVNWRSNLRAVIGLRSPEDTGYRASGVDVASAQGDGFVVLVTTGYREDPSGGFTIARVDADGTRIWSTTVESNRYRNEVFSGVSVMPTADGGFLTVGTRQKLFFHQFVTLNKFDSNGNRLWGKELSFPYPAASDSPGYTKAHRAILLADGNVLLVGETRGLQENGTRGWAAKVDGLGNTIWQQRYSAFPYALTDVIPNPDGSGSFIAVAVNNIFNILPNGDLIPTTTRPSFESGASIASDGSGQPFYVVLDKVAQNGGEFRLTGYNGQNQDVWSRTLGGSADDSPSALLTTGDGYLLVGTTTSTDGDVQGKQGNALATWVVKLTKNAPPLVLTQPTYNCQTGAITFNTTGGDGSPITYNAPGISRSSATSNTGTVEPGLRDDPKPITITATQSGYTVSFTFDFKAFCNGTQPPVNPPTPPVNPPTANAFTLAQPIYDCQTGAITFTYVGGDGSPITYNAPGVIRSSATSDRGTVEQELRNDPKPITITATQSGQTSRYTFDFKAFCGGTQPPVLLRPIPDFTFTVSTGVSDQFVSQYFSTQTSSDDVRFTASGLPLGLSFYDLRSLREAYFGGFPRATGVYTVTVTATNITLAPPNNSVSTTFKITIVDQPVVDPPTGNTLALLAPTYNCTTGAITFRSSGGNGSGTPAAPIEYAAAGITGWTTNPNQLVDPDSRMANDVKPFTLMARQNGVTVSYVWDLKAACGRARVGVGEPVAELNVSVLGNPVSEAVTVAIRGAEGQPLSLRLIDGRGRVIENRLVEQAVATEQQRFDLHQQGPGLLLLRVSSGLQAKTVKIVKQ